MEEVDRQRSKMVSPCSHCGGHLELQRCFRTSMATYPRLSTLPCLFQRTGRWAAQRQRETCGLESRLGPGFDWFTGVDRSSSNSHGSTHLVVLFRYSRPSLLWCSL